MADVHIGRILQAWAHQYLSEYSEKIDSFYYQVEEVLWSRVFFSILYFCTNYGVFCLPDFIGRHEPGHYGNTDYGKAADK
jgi:hypothetical protein